MSATKPHDALIFMGRFQPIHNGHLHIIRTALEQADYIIILIGSAHQPRTIKNPWSWAEREEMIRSCFSYAENTQIYIGCVEDYLYNDNEWVIQTAAAAYKELSVVGLTENANVSLIGHHKDNSSYYLDMFPQWGYVEVENTAQLNATDIRNDFFDPHQQCLVNLNELPPTVGKYILDWRYTDHFELLQEELQFYKEHTAMWVDAPYPPTFNTSDSVVIQAGHVLLIRRKNAPGRNALALPGGYLDPSDVDTLACAIRELKEETRLKVPIPVLHGSLFADKVFAHPDRSLRGRIITHAFGFKLDNLDSNGKLQDVRAADDAFEAMWVPLYKLRTIEYKSQMFEDHLSIINWFASRI